jgi:hypothetical protein
LRPSGRKETTDFEQELTEVTEISVSNLGSCIKLLCERPSSDAEKKKDGRYVACFLSKPIFVLNLCDFASLREISLCLSPFGCAQVEAFVIFP